MTDESKALKDRSTPRIERVTWMDAWVEEGLRSLDEMHQGCPVDSVGFVVEETDRHLRLAREAHSEGQWRGTLTIPKALVVDRMEVSDYATPR